MTVSPIRILLVDDNVFAVKLLSIQLSEYGYITHIASHGKAALDLLEKNTYSLIISDVHMPVMDGIELLSVIRQNPLYATIPIIIMSSDNDEELMIKMLDSGADDYVIKPIQSRVFLSKIQTILAKHSLQKKILSKQLQYHFTNTQSVVFICVSDAAFRHETLSLLMQSLPAQCIVIGTPQDFQMQFAEHSDVCLFVYDSVLWLHAEIEKISALYSQQKIPLIYFYESSPVHVYHDQCNVFALSQMSDMQDVVKLLDFVLQMLDSQRKQSQALLKQSVFDSSFVFEREKLCVTERFRISVLHENYNDMPGGDFYEIVEFNARYSFVFIGDIMGKSWSAWLYVPAYLAYIRSTIKFLSARNIKELLSSPHKIINLLNSYFAKDLQLSNVFSTLTVLVLDNELGKIILSSAGGIFPLYYSSVSNQIQDVRIAGMLLGIDATTEYSKVELLCSSKDVLGVYTDGYIEIENTDTSKLLGKESVKKVFTNFVTGTNRLAQDFDSEYMKYFSVSKHTDDRTMVIVECL